MKDKMAGYHEIKSLVLESYFMACRDLGLNGGWTFDKVIVNAIDGYEYSFHSDIENLMYHVISIIMTGGWITKQMEYHIDQAKRIMKETDIEKELSYMSKEEIEEFLFDLKLVGITVSGD